MRNVYNPTILTSLPRQRIDSVLTNNGSWFINENRIDGVIVSAPASIAVDRGLEPRSVKPKTIKLVSVVSPLSTQH